MHVQCVRNFVDRRKRGRGFAIFEFADKGSRCAHAIRQLRLAEFGSGSNKTEGLVKPDTDRGSSWHLFMLKLRNLRDFSDLLDMYPQVCTALAAVLVARHELVQSARSAADY
jgi:hypothetical protein